MIFEAGEGLVASIFGNVFIYSDGAYQFMNNIATAPSSGPIVVQIDGTTLYLGDETFKLPTAPALSGVITFTNPEGYVSCIQIADTIQSASSITYNQNRCNIPLDCSAITDAFECVNSGCEYTGETCQEFCAPYCYSAYLVDNQCQQDCNNPSCGYDSGDWYQILFLK